MNTIEINATAESLNGTIEHFTRTIERNADINSPETHLSLEDHQKLLPILLALITEAKAVFQDPDYPAEPRTTLLRLNWHLRLVAPNGGPQSIQEQTITEHAYFQQAAQFPELTPIILDYCHHTDHGAYDTRLWSNDELPAGTYAILPLVYRDRAAIDHYIEFLRTNDMEITKSTSPTTSTKSSPTTAGAPKPPGSPSPALFPAAANTATNTLPNSSAAASPNT